MADCSTGSRGSWTQRITTRMIGAAMLGMVTALPKPACAQIPCRYQVEAIFQAPPGPISISPTYPLSISPNSQWVVGYYIYDGVAQPRGWYYEMPNGPIMPLPHPPGTLTSTATDVNDAGQICGYIYISGSGGYGFVFDIKTQQYTLLPPAYLGECAANSINAQGVVCGTRAIAAGLTSSFVWSPATGFQDAGAIDGMSNGFKCITDNGLLAGWRGSNEVASNARAIIGPVSSPQVLPPVIGGTTSMARSINSSGDVCGYGRTPSPSGGTDVRAFLWSRGQMTMLGVLPGHQRSRANEIADNGLIGGQSDTPYAPRAFVWYDGVMRDVTAMIEVSSGQLVEMGAVGGISNNAWLVGYGSANGVSDLVIVLSPAAIPGDVTGDCAVDVSDLLTVITCWGAIDCEGDADGDGLVDVDDLLMVISNWTF